MLFDNRTGDDADRVASTVAIIAARHGVRTRFQPAESLLDGGLTSVAMVELMLAVECEFGLTIPDADLTPANFFSVASLAGLVGRLRPADRDDRTPPKETATNSFA